MSGSKYFYNEQVLAKAIILILLSLFRTALTCHNIPNEDSKTDLIKIELTKNGETIITIGNLFKLGQLANSQIGDRLSTLVPISMRTSSVQHQFNTDSTFYRERKLSHRARPYNTLQIPISPPTIVTTRRLMQNYDVSKSRINNPNKRHLNGNDSNNLHTKNTGEIRRNQESKHYNVIKSTTITKSHRFASDYPDESKINVETTERHELQTEPKTGYVLHEDTESTAIPLILTTSKEVTNDILVSDTISSDVPLSDTAVSVPSSSEQMDIVNSERLLMMDRLQKIVDNHYSWNILNSEDADCGESHSDRIIGGVEASLGQFPWIARLGYTVLPELNLTEFRCGGVLIGHQFVLTAAHCVSNLGPRTTMTKVRLGEHDIISTKDCVNDVCAEPVQDFHPVNITAHEEFMKRKYGNDIAIIKLDRPAIYNGWVSPICLPRGSLLHNSYFGESANVAGWGIMDMETQSRAEKLQTVSLPILSLDQCQKEYKKKVVLTEEQLCAGSELNKDACGGDSGGPLMKVATETGIPQYFLVGIVSFGPTDCGKKEPGVYANVSYHMPWILDKVEQLV